MNGLTGLSLQLHEPPLLTANNHSPDYHQINSIADDNNNNLSQQNYNMNHEHHHQQHQNHQNHQQHLPANHVDSVISTSNANGQQQVIVNRLEQNQQQQPVHVPKPRGRRKKIRTEPIRPICPQCEKQFSNQSALTKHKLTHSDERKFACQQCSKAFKRHDHLTGHMQTHSNRKPFNCTIQGCDKTYCDARSLRRHKENIHHIITPRESNHHGNNNINHHHHHHDHNNHTNGIGHNDNNSINCDGLDTSIGINSTTTTMGVSSTTKNTTSDQLHHSPAIDVNNNDVSTCNGSFVCDRDSAINNNGHHLNDGRLMSANEQQQQQLQPHGDATSLNYHTRSQQHLNQYNGGRGGVNQQHQVDFKSTQHEMSTNTTTTTNCPPPTLPHHTQEQPNIQSLIGPSNNNGLGGARWPSNDLVHVHPNNHQHHLNSSHHHHQHHHHSSYNHHSHQAPFSADYALAQNHHFSFDFNHLPHLNGDRNQTAISQPPNSAASLTDLSGISSNTSVSRQHLHQLPPQQLQQQHHHQQQQQPSNQAQPYGGNYLTPTTLHPSPQFITSQSEQQPAQLSYQTNSNQQHHQSSGNDPTIATTVTEATTTSAANTSTANTTAGSGATTTQMLQHTSPATSNPPPAATIQETQQSSLYQRRIQRHHSDGGSYGSLESQSDRLDLMRGPAHLACAADSSTQHHQQQQYHQNHHLHASYSADYASTQNFDFEFINSNRDNASTMALGASSGGGNAIGTQHAISLTDLGSGNLASPVVINQDNTSSSGDGSRSGGVAMDSMDTVTAQRQHLGYLTPTTLHPVSEQQQPQATNNAAYQSGPSEQVPVQSPGYATTTRAAPTQTPTTPTAPSACAQQQQQPSHLLRRRIQRHSAQSSYGNDPEQAARLDLINRPVQIACGGSGVGPASSGAIQSVAQHLGNNTTSQMNHYQTTNNHLDQQSQQQHNHQHNFPQQHHHHNQHNHHQQNNLHQASYSADYASTQHFNFDFTNHQMGDHHLHHHHHADQPLGSNTIPLSADSITDSGLGLNMHFEQQMTPNSNQQYELKL